MKMVDWKDNLGDVYNIEGVSLTIVGSTKVKYKPRKYILKCSTCSEDTELFPYGSISCTKGNLQKGQIPCGCRKGYRWSESQNIVRIGRVCKERGYILHGWFGSYKSDTTYLSLENPITGNKWNTTSINNLLHGFGDPVAGRKATIAGSFKDDAYHIKGFLASGVFPEGTTFSRVKKQKWVYVCGGCKQTFTSSGSSLKMGKMSCNCNGRVYGFSKSREAYCYIVRWGNEKESYLKNGITNRDVWSRITDQARCAKLSYEILYAFYNESGSIISDCEKYIKANLERCVCDKELLPDGYTETYHDTEENLNSMLNYLTKELGEPVYNYKKEKQKEQKLT
jgi:hypothetical protein